MRLFVALELDEAVRRAVDAVQRRMKAVLPDLRWVRSDQMHLTIKFLGSTPPQQLKPLCDALRPVAEQSKPFDFELAGTGVFPSVSRARVLWLGVNEPTGRLQRLQELTDQVTARLGFPSEQRAYRPHLTLARIKGRCNSNSLQRAIEQVGDGSLALQGVEELTLFQSDLRPGGAVYTVVGHWPLGG